jgi:hypothetical protein
LSRQVWTWIGQAALGATLGLALAVAVGWWLWPITDADTVPSVLRQDYHDDYVVMVATAYEVGRDLEQARARLALLEPGNPAAPAVELAERLIVADGSVEDIARLARLARDLGAITPALSPYAGSGP